MANPQQDKKAPINLISECFVKPKYEPTKQPYHLGPIDLLFLTIDPIQKGLLFTLNNSPSFSSCESQNIENVRTKIVCNLLEKLKCSLSIALVHFYPLAGRYTIQKYPDDNACSIYVDCNKGPGARFIYATALGLAVSDVQSPVDVSIVHPFFDLGEKYVNYDCHTKALLSIQVTELLDGVFIGFSMSHSVVDGTSFVHFMNVLSEIFRSLDNHNSEDDVTNISSSVPIFNYRPWDVPVLKLPFIDVEEFIYRGYDPGPLRERIFHFSPSSMAKLKAEANQECDTNNVISSFQALTALVWRSITRIQNLPQDQQTTCFLAMGARSRLNPPISDDYFGNFISRAQWACKVEELLGNSLGWVAMNLNKIIKANDGKEILDYYKMLVNPPIVVPRGIEPDVHGMNSVIMGGSARFDIYGPEFGLGRALAARMGYGNEDGKITANPGCEGGGSVDLEICLGPHIMAALEDNQEFMSFVS
ncbi:protein ENHANCED PSEUDOMONAS SUSCEPTIBILTY 1-like [Chenopodium quinoa]|uniref:Uncharacterized protein n=1 Tax=Chenopodium quinoa TaxID=63459 RepID=A0A803LPI6_CHEQI|nr:protein ENHANCED PSEUDOMONAS SUSCEPTIBILTY 1-like [Chenopodium quinoa]